MNKHTLNYHTRLHDWYRQHSIQVQRQELQQGHSQQQQQQLQQQEQQHKTPDPAGQGEVLPSEGGNLTQDKLHAIHDWCADVNRNLFRVKKREAPPLFRRCRVASASTVASRGSSVAVLGRQKVKNEATGSAQLQLRSADPRRVRSAEVFTMTGHWAKQPKVRVTGGELLAKRPGTAPRNIYSASSAQRAKQISEEELDLCVRNSKDKTDLQDVRALPRVNHDSFHLRQNALVLKQNGPRLTERMPGSPRDSAVMTPEPSKHANRLAQSATRQQVCTPCKSMEASGVRRTKSAHPGHRLRFMDEAGEVLRVPNNITAYTHEENDNQRAVEVIENAKNDEHSRSIPGTLNTQEKRVAKVSAKEGKEESRDTQATMLQIKPAFCNTCSGIYSGSTDALAPPACGECIHGINLDSTQQHHLNTQQQQRQQRISMAAKMSAEEKLAAELRKTEAEVSIVEARLFENGIHYSEERAAIREENGRPGLGRPSTSSAAQLRARLASQLALDEGTDEGEEERVVRDQSEYSDDEHSEADVVDNLHDASNENEERRKEEEGGSRKEELHVTLVTDRGSHEDDKYQNVGEGQRGEEHLDGGQDARGDDHGGDTKNYDNNNLITNGGDDTDGEEKDPKRMTRPSLARDGRRKSISFSYKPVIANPSVSNGLLNVLSIDDCKFHMRYSPHKVLEEHEITENLMLPLALLQFNNGNDENDKNNNSISKQQQNETNSRVAMRISRGSSPDENRACNDNNLKSYNINIDNEVENFSPNTSIRSSTARHATAANVRKFNAINDPDNINFHHHQRPQSACLARAFHTLIHDRTVMQRFDNVNNNLQSNKNRTSGGTVRPTSNKMRGAVKPMGKSPRPTTKVGAKRTSGVHGGRDILSNSKKCELSDTLDSTAKAEGGPRYRLINAALRRHMGDLLQEQCKKLQVRYQRQRNLGALGAGKMKHRQGGNSPSPTPSLSLSLDSLPETKKGILKSPTSPGSPIAQNNETEHQVIFEVPSSEAHPIADVEQ